MWPQESPLNKHMSTASSMITPVEQYSSSLLHLGGKQEGQPNSEHSILPTSANPRPKTLKTEDARLRPLSQDVAAQGLPKHPKQTTFFRILVLIALHYSLKKETYLSGIMGN